MSDDQNNMYQVVDPDIAVIAAACFQKSAESVEELKRPPAANFEVMEVVVASLIISLVSDVQRYGDVISIFDKNVRLLVAGHAMGSKAANPS